ncbi:MAG: hypothetical protein HZB25_04750 [Candidatus Eisenbacteria bacterium]|nr:hypothetical protein [Candidatus Eisenbacteria bacterium]
MPTHTRAALVFAAILALGPGAATASPAVDVYLSAASAAPGESVGIHVSSTFPTVNLRVIRLGAVNDTVLSLSGLPAANPATPDSAYARGCGWPAFQTLQVPAGWRTGLYDVQVFPASGNPLSHAPLVVRAVSPGPSGILLVMASNTWQAYNGFGGKSLYEYNSSGGVRSPRVSYNRPYDSANGLGFITKWEVPFLRWLERSGFEADYVTDVDLATRPEVLAGHRLMVTTGHSEYWSASMFDAAQDFADSAGNLAILGANTCYWQVRFTDNARTVICHKNYTDPIFALHPESTTVNWRASWVWRPEAQLLGSMLSSCQYPVSRPIHFARCDGWLTLGLEQEVGHDLGSQVMGYEYDVLFPGISPPSVVSLFETPVSYPDGSCPQTAVTTYYERRPAEWSVQGGGVFNAGTIQWSWGLDSTAAGPADWRIQLLTSNLLHGLSRRLSVRSATTLVVRAAIPGHLPGFPGAFTVTATEDLGGASHDPVSLLDNGAWPDSVAGDGIYSGRIPIVPGSRLPLVLRYRLAGTDLCGTRGVARSWLETGSPSDSLSTWGTDTLAICPGVVGVPPRGDTDAPRLLCRPNPAFSAQRFTWSGSPGARVEIFDTSGRRVARVGGTPRSSAAAWGGQAADGKPVAAGVYWARLEGVPGSRAVRLVRLK